MFGNRRNLVFRVSIVINVCVLLYAAMHLSGSPAGGEWMVQVTGDGGASELRFLPREEHNDTALPIDPTAFVRNYDETTSQKTPSTVPVTNKTAFSTAETTEPGTFQFSYIVDSAVRVPRLSDELFYLPENENKLTHTTLQYLGSFLNCVSKDYRTEYVQRGEFWVLKNYVKAGHGPVPCHVSITYTTHGGYEFFENVEPLVKRWVAPISIAVHAPGTDFEATMNSIKYLRACLEWSWLIRQYVTFHIFFSNKHMPSKILDPNTFMNENFDCSGVPPYMNKTITTFMKEKALLYPINVARNIAREAAMTHFILPSDIELYPSPNLIPKFLNMIARNDKPLSTSNNPRIFPLSIFEVSSKVNVPLTKTELQQMLKNKTAIPFHKNVCANCHTIPEGKQWIDAPETKRMDVFHVGKRQGKYVHWEPIYIGTHEDPYFDERLSWEGKQDKMTQGYILCVKDYDFMILNNAFLVHKPGIKGYVMDKKRQSVAAKQSTYIKKRIMPELRIMFGVRKGCGL